MLIAQMTDIHIGFDPAAKPEELNRIRFRKTLDRLLAQPNAIDLLVLTGDLTDHGDADSFEKTAALLEAVPCPILPMVGNHDSREGLLHAFPDTPTEGGFVHYVHEQDGLLLVMLDTLEPGRHGGAFCTARRDWLRRQLEAHPDTPTLIFMHHPPVVSGIDWMDPAPDEEWIANFAAAIDGHDQILAIHCGHLHRPLHTSFRGVPLGVTPSVAPLVSLDLRPIDPTRADNRDLITTEPATYALHRWDGESLVTHYEKTNSWDVLAFYGEHLKPMMKDMFEERE
ncbi:MAG: phosphodiesterase [Sphingomonadaceae bacterium]|nr:phosphodiesterase [Sphingomonadaceae bacterium]MCP5383114.1 phosphodiesterase [Altererythrobacter sp.]MCP5390396.1 phosphodiesterase [Sphingomonadaceae bacterium]MCP5393291.1 phosphodiesterase [Sphingomonadaceae bacterium]